MGWGLGGGDNLITTRKSFTLEQKKGADFVIFNNCVTISSENLPHTKETYP